jgi:hypothetical protein
VATVSSQPHASMSAGLWWRIRRTTTGTTAGLMFGIYSNHSRTASFTGAGTSRPEPVGGSILNHADALAAYNSNKAASHSFAYAPDYVDGTCWIRTNAVEGILCSGKFSTYHAWYGCGSLWARYPDTETGTQTHHVDSGQGTDVGNGNWCTGRSMHYFFVIDPQHVLEAHSDLRAANPSGYNPEKYYHVRDHFPHPTDSICATGSAEAGTATDRQVSFSQAMVFDRITNQVLLWHGRYGGTDPHLMVFNVRNS